jgi:dienelactone hydrolase
MRKDLNPFPHPSWSPTSITTGWDDLLEGIDSPEAWMDKREAIHRRFLALIRDEAAPESRADLEVRVEERMDEDDYAVERISYQVGDDERAHAYVAVPHGSPPKGGYPGVICLHGTTNWGARQSLGLPPLQDDPQACGYEVANKDFARQLTRRGYVTLSPEHFCAGNRMPPEGPFDTSAFYRKHPRWSAAGKFTYENHLACTVLSNRTEVNADRIGVTGHSLGGQGSIWLAAYDSRICCAAPSCCAPTFRQNPDPLHWSRDHWYVYFPQLREAFCAGQTISCDFHEMMSLIAPRPLMERFALNDGHPLTQGHRNQLHFKLHDLYRLLGAEEAHAFLVFGDGHSIPGISSACMLAWMARWLKHDGRPYEDSV